MTAGDTSWFIRDRFGMFIHWGLYALPARHEWVQNREEIPPNDYQKYFERFNPDLYDPHEWAQAARAAGMKYAVLTSKHHEGFCLWDSQYTDYKVTNTPYGQDLLRPYVDAFTEAGLRVGFYYSLIDWHHPQFPIDVHHPLRNHPDATEMNKDRDVTQYAEYLHNQVRELLTTFPEIDILWLDFSYPGRDYRGMPGKGHQDWQSEKLYNLIREIKPDIILNNRLDLQDQKPDIYTPEQYQPTHWPEIDGERVTWEACQTFSGSWGYHRDEMSWKSPQQLIEMLINTVSCGGNLLMNVGPTARGTFDQRAIDALNTYAEWMRLNNRAIYNCTQCDDFTPPPDVRYTQNGDRLYVHIFTWPFRYLHLPGLRDKVEYAQLLHDASEVILHQPDYLQHPYGAPVSDDVLTLTLPVIKPDVTIPVIELFLK